jgi:hypothetical protein
MNCERSTEIGRIEHRNMGAPDHGSIATAPRSGVRRRNPAEPLDHGIDSMGDLRSMRHPVPFQSGRLPGSHQLPSGAAPSSGIGPECPLALGVSGHPAQRPIMGTPDHGIGSMGDRRSVTPALRDRSERASPTAMTKIRSHHWRCIASSARICLSGIHVGAPDHGINRPPECWNMAPARRRSVGASVRGASRTERTFTDVATVTVGAFAAMATSTGSARPWADRRLR